RTHRWRVSQHSPPRNGTTVGVHGVLPQDDGQRWRTDCQAMRHACEWPAESQWGGGLINTLNGSTTAAHYFEVTSSSISWRLTVAAKSQSSPARTISAPRANFPGAARITVFMVASKPMTTHHSWSSTSTTQALFTNLPLSV